MAARKGGDVIVAGATAGTPEKDEKLKPLKFLEILGSTFAAAIGVQRFENRKRDFTRGNAIHFVISGILFVVCFVAGMIALVHVVIGQS